MSNQVALHAQTTPGDEIFLHAKAHIVDYEQGGAAVLIGLQTRTFDSPRRHARSRAARALLPHRRRRAPPAHHAGGRREHAQLLRRRGATRSSKVARAARLLRPPRHDPAPGRRPRVQRGRRQRRGGRATSRRPYDSVSVCLSKGLGAPVGSVLLGSAAMIARAQRARKLLRRRHAPGGHHRRRRPVRPASTTSSALADDHRRARGSAERLAARAGPARRSWPSRRPTWSSPTPRASGLPAAAAGASAARARACWPWTKAPWSVRFVTHLDVDDEAVERAGEIVASIIEKVVA